VLVLYEAVNLIFSASVWWANAKLLMFRSSYSKLLEDYILNRPEKLTLNSVYFICL
jgi:hypothetical protein